MDDIEINKIVINSLLEQYGAALKTLERIINKCPDDYWEDSISGPPFYKIVYHLLFFNDLYRSGTKEERTSFTPRFTYAEDFRTSKENFHPSEWAVVLSKRDLLDYLHDLKIKWQKRIENLTAQELINEPIFEWHGSSLLSSMIYNLRHIMVHIGALQVRLRMQGIKDQYWVSQNPIIE